MFLRYLRTQFKYPVFLKAITQEKNRIVQEAFREEFRNNVLS